MTCTRIVCKKCGGKVERWRRISYDKAYNKTSAWTWECEHCGSISAANTEEGK